MRRPIEILGVYLHLARAAELRRQPLASDRLLILAAAGAAQISLPRVAAYCREKVLAHNQRHLIGRWPTVAEALADPDFHNFLGQLQRRYPLEKAERMLATLQIETARERDAYFSDEEFAAALLGTNPESLAKQFPQL